MTLNDKQKQFIEQGYYIEKNCFAISEMTALFDLFIDLSWSIAKRNNIEIPRYIPSPSKAVFPDDMKKLDEMMLKILNHDTSLIGELYDTVSYSSTFLRFISNQKVETLTKQLLSLDSHISLYGYTNRIRIDPPNDDRRTYGWHQEVFYTIPEARYLQTWCPILRNTTIDNGTIEIKPQSHKEGIAKQTWNEVKGRATQIIIDDDILDKYKTIQLEMEVGDLLFFDGRLAHRSGTNSTADEIRFSLVGMWHDTSHLPFRAPLPNFESRTITAKEYYKKTKN